jgi:hypothetical protein
MPNQPCPACSTSAPRMLHDTSNVWDVDYYRCPACAHLWTMSTQSGTILHHVTSLEGSRHKWTEEFDPFEGA